MAITKSTSKSAQMEVATWALIDHPGTIVNVIGKCSGNWATVMGSIKDWVQAVSSTNMCAKRGIHMSTVNCTVNTNSG